MTRKILLFSFLLRCFIGCLTYNFMIFHGKAFLGCFCPPPFNATAAFVVMRDLCSTPSLIFSPAPPHLCRDWSPTLLLSSHQDSWPFSVIQTAAAEGSETLNVDPDPQLLCILEQLGFQLLHTWLLSLTFFTFFHTFCSSPFCFPNHCFILNVLRLFVAQLPLPVMLA